jgi:hypothetical protein
MSFDVSLLLILGQEKNIKKKSNIRRLEFLIMKRQKKIEKKNDPFVIVAK